MRNVLSVLAAAAGLGLLATGAAAQAPKIAYIDSRKIIAEAPGAKEAQATFDREMQGYQGQLKLMEDSLKTLMDDYQQKSVTLSPEAKKQREDAIRARQDAYQQRASQLEEQAGQRQSQLVQPILDRIKVIISQIRAEGGYAFILDVGQGGSIVAADTTLDLTRQVLARLARSTVSAPPAAPATTPAKPAAQPAKKP